MWYIIGIIVVSIFSAISGASMMMYEKPKIKVRPEVLEFAKEMEKKLKKNDWKGGWDNCSPEELIRLLKREVDELEYYLEEYYDHKDRGYLYRMSLEAVDIANFAMMIWDNCNKGRIKGDN